MHVEAGVLTGDSVPHGVFEDTIVDKRHSEYRESWWNSNKQVVELDNSDALRLYRTKRSDNRHTTTSANPHSPRSRSRHITPQ